MTPRPRDIAVYFAARVVPALLSMALTFLCIHSLSAEDYGRYSLTLLPATVAAGLVGGLSGQAMLRHAGELAPAAMWRGLVGLPLLAAACVCPVVLVYLSASVGLSAASVVAVGLVPLIALMDTRRSLFVAGRRARAVLSMDVLRALCALALAALLFRLWGSRALVPLTAQVAAIVVCLSVVRPAPAKADALRTMQVDRRYAAYGVWLAGWLAVVAGLSLAERSIVESVSGLAASGRYAAQADVVNAVFAATAGALASSMMPSYLALVRAPDAAVLRRLQNIGLGGTLLAAALCVVLGLIVFFFAEPRVAQSLTGDASTALALVAAGAVWTAAAFAQKPLELRSQTHRVFLAALAALLLFFVVAPIAARSFGPPGVAVAKALAGLAFIGIVEMTARTAKAAAR